MSIKDSSIERTVQKRVSKCTGGRNSKCGRSCRPTETLCSKCKRKPEQERHCEQERNRMPEQERNSEQPHEYDQSIVFKYDCPFLLLLSLLLLLLLFFFLIRTA
jgi:hypothetical protein